MPQGAPSPSRVATMVTPVGIDPQHLSECERVLHVDPLTTPRRPAGRGVPPRLLVLDLSRRLACRWPARSVRHTLPSVLPLPMRSLAFQARRRTGIRPPTPHERRLDATALAPARGDLNRALRLRQRDLGWDRSPAAGAAASGPRRRASRAARRRRTAGRFPELPKGAILLARRRTTATAPGWSPSRSSGTDGLAPALRRGGRRPASWTTSPGSGFPAGTELILFADGARVGRLTLTGTSIDERFCSPRLTVHGVVELLPAAGSTRAAPRAGRYRRRAASLCAVPVTATTTTTTARPRWPWAARRSRRSARPGPRRSWSLARTSRPSSSRRARSRRSPRPSSTTTSSRSARPGERRVRALRDGTARGRTLHAGLHLVPSAPRAARAHPATSTTWTGTGTASSEVLLDVLGTETPLVRGTARSKATSGSAPSRIPAARRPADAGPAGP